MKKAIALFCLIFVVYTACYAGGPLIPQKTGETQKAEKSTMQLKTVAIEYLPSDYFMVKRHFTLGLGLGGNPMIGFVEKDGFGYPMCEYGITNVLGYGYTWISGQPSEKQLQRALDAIRSKTGNIVEESKLPAMVRDEVGIKELKYVEFGTFAAVIPLNLEMGTMWILNDNVRTRLGFGLPTLISFGINFDF